MLLLTQIFISKTVTVVINKPTSLTTASTIFSLKE